MSTHGKVRILHNTKILLLWHIIKIEKYLPEVADQTISIIEARCAIMQDQKGDVINIDCIASNIINDFRKFLTYQVQYGSFENPIQRDAFEIMREAATALYLPKLPLVKSPNSLDVLKQDVLNYIELNKSRWKKNIVEKEAKDFVIDLSKALWFVDKCGPNTFSQRYNIPKEFEQFVRRYNPNKHKKARPHFNYDNLSYYASTLKSYLKQSWISAPRFDFLRIPLTKFSNDLQSYGNYLCNQNQWVKANHASKIPVVNEIDAGTLKVYFLSNQKSTFDFEQLIDTLNATEYWVPIQVDSYCPSQKK